MNILVLLRHGESTWNKENRFTGWTDVDLSEKGVAEAKNAAKLNHNNIVHVYDLIKTDDGQFYIIMEYIDGLDLRQLLKICKSKGVKIPTLSKFTQLGSVHYFFLQFICK